MDTTRLKSTKENSCKCKVIHNQTNNFGALLLPKKRLFLRVTPILVYGFDKSPKAGYGHCRSCDCRGYISKHNGSHECKICNHHYDRHN